MTHAKITPAENAELYLASTEYIDAGHPRVAAIAADLTYGADSDAERIRRIYHYVRDLPYDVLESFRYLARGQHAASDVLAHGLAFCMGKASSFVALSRAAGVPARVAFQTLDSPDKEFLSPEVRVLWGSTRPLPWHSVGEAYLNGRWLKLDATIDPPTAVRFGKPYRREFDGISDIPTVEGPILRENGSYADYPLEVAQWYEIIARAVIGAQDDESRIRLAADDQLWAGPHLEDVLRRAVR